MSRTAVYESSSPLLASPVEDGSRPLVGITVDSRTPLLARADFLRMDPSQLTLHEIETIRRRQLTDAMIDLPGGRTRRRQTVLTRTELLLYAATEGFGWVNLRDIRSLDEVHQADEMLPESTRLSISTADLSPISDWPTELWQSIDLLVVECPSYLGLTRALSTGTLEVALLAAAAHGVACHVMGEMLPSLESSERANVEEVIVLSGLVRRGAAGLLLDRPPTEREDTQLAVDILRLVSQQHEDSRRRSAITRRPAARLDQARTRPVAELLDG